MKITQRGRLFGLIALAGLPASVPAALAETAENEPTVEFSAGYKYQHWVPTHINNADYRTKGLNLAVFDVGFTGSGVFGGALAYLPKLHYEKTPDSSPEQKEIVALSKQNAAWERIVIDQPLYLSENGYWALTYDKQVFQAKVTSRTARTYYSKHGEQSAFAAGSTISSLTTFQDFGLGNYQADDKDGRRTRNGVGVFYTEYEKPYSITIAGQQKTADIFDAKFSAAGFLLQSEKFVRKPGSSSEVGGAVNARFGWGKIKVANETLFAQSSTGVALLNLDLNYGIEKQISRNFSAGINGRVDYRYFYQYNKNSGDTDSTLGVTDLNDDLILSVMANLKASF